MNEIGQDIIKELVLSEEDLLREAVSMAKSLIAIEQRSGNVIVRVPKTFLTARDLIGLHLIGNYFSSQLGKEKSPNMSLTDLSRSSGIDPATASSRLAELVNAGWVIRVNRGEFAVNPYLMKTFLGEISAEISKPKEEASVTTNPIAQTSGGPLEPEMDSLPDVGRSKSLTEAIVQLLGTPWGKSPRDWREIREALKHNAMHFSAGSVTGTLTLLTQSHRVRRIKEGRSYRYLLP